MSRRHRRFGPATPEPVPFPPLLVPAWLASAILAPSELASPDVLEEGVLEVDAVELPWARYEAMRAVARGDDAPAPGPWASEREAELTRVEGGWELRVRWTIEAPTPGWIAAPLAGPGIELRTATWRRERAPVLALPTGTQLVAWVEADDELELRAFVPGSLDERLRLELMPATRGRLRVSAPGRVPVPVVETTETEAPPVLDGGVVWSGARVTVLELRDPDRAPPSRETLAVAHAGVGITVGDAELRGRAHLQWELRHGTLDRVSATVAGLGEDLTIAGRDLASWTRNGDTIDVELSSPVSGRVDLDLRWSQALPTADEASVELPRVEPRAWRSESSLQVARDGEVEVVPRAEQWSAIASAELPQWGRGLVEGTPTAAYRRTAGPAEGTLELLRFVPVAGPPTVVDVAAYTMATTEEGRVLMRAHYELRNDRGAHLTVRPPPGLRIIGARVAGETAVPSRDEQGAWRLPLKRSLETVEGLLSFPVEVILLGEQEPWERRERRELPLPTLDTPIAASHATVYLPPRYRSRLEVGEHDVVDEFAEGEGLTYGLGVGEVGSAAADALFQEAVEGYLSNDFDRAQAKLEELEGLGLRNENMARLQSNIDVIEGKADGEADVALQRRVKEQARARAAEQFRQQEVLIEEAEKAASSGDYEEAEAQYQAALELGDDLAKLEQSESVEQQAKNANVALELKTVAKKKGKRRPLFKGRKDGRALGSSSSVATKLETKPEPAAATEPPADAPPPVLDPTEASTEEPVPNAPAEEELEEEREEALEPEPLPEPELPSPDYDADRIAFEDADAGVFTVARRSRGRRRWRPFGNVRRRHSRMKAAGATSSGVSVYDFEDDSLDGELLRPEGADISARARADAGPMVDVPAQIPVTDELGGEEATAAMADPATIDLDDGAAAALDPLPAPEVTASALSVVIPAAGQAVRYEQLLIEANQTQTITIDARRRLRRR